MLQNTTQAKQGTGSGDTHMKARSDNDAGVVRIKDEPTGEELNTVGGEEKILADDARGDHSTVSTEASHDGRTFSSPPSPILEAETDPTSIPSGILDDLEFERKDTESPKNSDDAVYGSDSSHSAPSDSSTADSSSREGLPIGVKVKAVGDHFGESSTETRTSRFHDPQNSWEAGRINARIKNMNVKIDDIERHPKESFRDHGSSYQVSARPKGPNDHALEMESSISNKRKVFFASNPVLPISIEEGYSVEERTKGKLSCCNIL